MSILRICYVDNVTALLNVPIKKMLPVNYLTKSVVMKDMKQYYKLTLEEIERKGSINFHENGKLNNTIEKLNEGIWHDSVDTDYGEHYQNLTYQTQTTPIPTTQTTSSINTDYGEQYQKFNYQMQTTPISATPLDTTPISAILPEVEVPLNASSDTPSIVPSQRSVNMISDTPLEEEELVSTPEDEINISSSVNL